MDGVLLGDTVSPSKDGGLEATWDGMNDSTTVGVTLGGLVDGVSFGELDMLPGHGSD